MAITRAEKAQADDKTSFVSIWEAASAVSLASGATLLVALGTGQLESTAVVSYGATTLTKVASNSRDPAQTNSVEQSIWVLFSATADSASITVSWDTEVEEKSLIAIQVSGINTFRSAEVAQGFGSVTNVASTGATVMANTFIWAIATIGGANGDAAGEWSSSYQASNQGVRIGTSGGAAISNVTMNEGYGIASTLLDGAAGNLSGFANRSWVALVATFYYVSMLDAYTVSLSHVGALHMAQLQATDQTQVLRKH